MATARSQYTKSPLDMYNPYTLNLVYHIDNLWMIVFYEGFAIQKDSKRLEFCPTNLRMGSNDGRIQDNINFGIQAGDVLLSLEDYSNLGSGISPFVGPLFKDATGEDEKAFYTKVMRSEGNTCFTAPISFWEQ
jgi:hypothetical protein